MLALALLAALGWALVAGWRATSTDAPGSPVVSEPAPTDTPAPPTPTPTPTATPPPDATFTLLAAGDVLPHGSVIRSAQTPAGFDFGPLLEPLDPWVRGADLALCHLEVPIAPDGSAPSGYPTFGAPPELADALRAQGWDGCSTASNHSLDRGRAGLVATLDTLDAAGLGHVGTARTAAEGAAAQLYRLERAGQTVTVGHVAGTYGLNGQPVPSDAPWSVTLLDPAVLIAQATAARAAGADVVVASVHCCVEYVTAPSPEQVDVARTLADSGVVDLVMGHHAHVPQPVARLEGVRGERACGSSTGSATCCPTRTPSAARPRRRRGWSGPRRWSSRPTDRRG